MGKVYLHFQILTATMLFIALQSPSQDRLKSLSRALDNQWRSERAAAESVAVKLNMPVRADRSGRTIELQRFEPGMPRYYATDNLNAARTVSTDKVWWTAGLGYFLSG